MAESIIITGKTNFIDLEDEKEVFGEVEEITSRAVGAVRTNLSKVTLWGPDTLHSHQEAEETYICLKGEGRVFLDGRIVDFSPGTRVIIAPGTIHAARPKEEWGKLIFLCIASPAFDPKDSHEDPRGRSW